MAVSLQLPWTQQEFDRFGLDTQITSHNLHTLNLFDRQTLIETIEHHPRKWLQAFTMGSDPTAAGDWQCVDIDPSTSASDIMSAIEAGRLWLNVTHIEESNAEYAALIQEMYQQLGTKCPHLENPKAHYSTLLISSPAAQVYYHLDAEPNMLWHIRGEKTIYVYPAMDTKFVSQDNLENIYAAEIDENIPFNPEYDNHATVHRLKPGEVASWPHNAPHRIVNHDLNVSLATSYYTPGIYKRQYVQLANRHLLRPLGISKRSMQEYGIVPSAKRMVFRVLNKLRPFKSASRSASYITDLQLDASAENGIRRLPEKQPASFSVLRTNT